MAAARARCSDVDSRAGSTTPSSAQSAFGALTTVSCGPSRASLLLGPSPTLSAQLFPADKENLPANVQVPSPSGPKATTPRKAGERGPLARRRPGGRRIEALPLDLACIASALMTGRDEGAALPACAPHDEEPTLLEASRAPSTGSASSQASIAAAAVLQQSPSKAVLGGVLPHSIPHLLGGGVCGPTAASIP